MKESNLVILQNTSTHLFSSYMRCLSAKLTLLMKYALILIGILTKKLALFQSNLPKPYKTTQVQDSSVTHHHNSVHAKNHDYKGCTLYLHQIVFLYASNFLQGL